MKALHHCLIWQKPVGSTGVVPGEDKCCSGMRVTGVVTARSIAELRGAHPDPESMAVSPCWGQGVTVPVSVSFVDVGGALGLSSAPPSTGVIFTLFQVTLLRGRRMGDAIINGDISPRGGMRWDAAAVPRPGEGGCCVPLCPPQQRDRGSRAVFPCSIAVSARCPIPQLRHGPGAPRFPGAAEHGGGGEGGRRVGDLTAAAAAHFTACHALMAEEIKAGMELFIEINQSPRRRGENNIVSSVIPGMQTAARPQEVPRVRLVPYPGAGVRWDALQPRSSRELLGKGGDMRWGRGAALHSHCAARRRNAALQRAPVPGGALPHHEAEMGKSPSLRGGGVGWDAGILRH